MSGSEVLVAVFPNEAIAQMWAGILKGEGIASAVRPRMGGFNVAYNGVFIPHAVYVLQKDADEARRLLADADEAGVSDDEDGRDEP